MDDPRQRGPKVDRSMPEQARFLLQCIKHEVTVTVFMSSGVSLMGIPRDFDGRCLLLGYQNPDKEPKLISTRGITLIRADEVLNLREEYRSEESALRKLRRKAARLAHK